MTTQGPPAPSSIVHRLAGGLVVAFVTFLVWLGLLSWDNKKVWYDTGPYATWQVVAVGVLLTLLLVGALVVGLDPFITSGAITLVLTACMFVSFVILPPPDPTASLWPIGLAMVFMGTAMASAAVCLAVAAVRPGRWRRAARHSSGPPARS